MKVYIAGKITGNENYKAEFAEAEEKLRELGHIPLNPAVLPEGLEKADYMRICLAMLDSADAIAPLLSWTRSDGAAIEMSLARYTDKKTDRHVVDTVIKTKQLPAAGRRSLRGPQGMRPPEGPGGKDPAAKRERKTDAPIYVRAHAFFRWSLKG